MDNKRAATIARSLGWLSQTVSSFQDIVLARSDLLQFSKGETVYSMGDDAGGLYGVIEGSIELHLPTSRGAPSLSYIAGPGFWAGDIAALTGRPRQISISAGSACWLLRLARADLTSITQEHPTAWRHMAELLARNYALSIDVIDALKREDPIERLAAMVLHLTSRDPGATPVVSVSQSDLGALARLSRSSVNAAISELQRRGWVRRAYASLEVIDKPGLSSFVRGG